MKIQHLILMAIIPFTSKAWTPCGTDSEGNTANCEYQIENNVLTIRGLGDNGNIGVWNSSTTPSPFEGKTFDSIIIYDSIKDLGTNAFIGVKSNKPVVVPSSVTETSKGSFASSKLSEVVLPNSVRFLKALSFASSDIEKIDIPNTVTFIGAYAFTAAKNLTDIIIPDSVQEIQGYAFGNCDNLKTLTIGENTHFDHIFHNGGSLTIDFSKLKIYCTGDTARCDQNLKDAGYDNLTTIKATKKTINGVKYILDSKGNIVATSGDRTEKRIYTLEEAEARVKEIGKDHVTFRIRYK